MKKSLALVLALIMVMGCMSFAAAEGEQFTVFNGTVTLSKPEGGDGTINLTNNAFAQAYDLTDSQWEEAFYNCGEDNGIYLTAQFTLPNTAVKYYKSLYDANATDDQCMNALKSAEYMDNGSSFGVGLKIAGVTYDGNNIIITPEHCEESVIIKWLDDKGADHFHRVKFNLTVSREGEGIKLTNASPANDRVILDSRAGVKGSYSDGTVRYEILEATGVEGGFKYDNNGEGATTTKFDKPSENATKATVNGKEVNIVDGAIELKVEARNNQSMTEAFTVRWFDGDGNIIKTERITISNLPIGAEAFWLKNWAPMDSGRIAPRDKGFKQFLTYTQNSTVLPSDEGRLLFKVTDGNAGSLNAEMLDYLCNNELIYEITPPEGATHFTMSGQHSPLYGEEFFTEITQNELENGEREPINGTPIYCYFGKLFNRAKVDGVYVYTVDSTEVGYADIVVFRWWKKTENNEWKIIKEDGTECHTGEGSTDKLGYYFYLVKEPYVKISETVAVSAAPTTAVENPTIVVSDSKGKEILRAEIPLQEAVDPNSNTKYLYMKLKYIDKETGLEVEPGTAGADVYLPYPDGMTYDNFNNYTVKLTHYTDENHKTHENVELEATPIGLKFKATSFSPFLLEWTPKGSSSSSASSGSSGGLSGVNIANRTNREISSYRLGGGLLSFRLAGSGAVTVTADGKVVMPDADGWYTVSANARIVVEYTAMALPKTGDMPLWRRLQGLIGIE